MQEGFWFALGLTAFAGLSTGLGGIFAFFTKKTDFKFLSSALSFSAGVMIYISFVEIYSKASSELVEYFGGNLGNVVTIIAFFAGILLILLIDKFVPDPDNPHHGWKEENVEAITNESPEEAKKRLEAEERQELHRVGLMSTLAIAIHNFPEGLVTFVSALHDPALGISIAIAIALHNIPEGVAAAIPIYYSSGSRLKAISYSFAAGLAEPVGALVGYFFFRSFFDDLVFGIIFALVAGIMVFISVDELLPASKKYGEGHREIYAF
ncbi:MAG: zinc transporter ZupT, partial [Bacillota bacterium]